MHSRLTIAAHAHRGNAPPTVDPPLDRRAARAGQVLGERPTERVGVLGARLPGVTRGNDTRAGPVIAKPIFRRFSSASIARSTARSSSGASVTTRMWVMW